MTNNVNFAKRLKKVLEYYHLSASQFAEKIQVQRSSISHLLSGRNKPSLDFVLKVLDAFEEVELYWLLKGKGIFPKKNTELDSSTTLFPENEKEDDKRTFLEDVEKQSIKKLSNNKTQNKDIEKIVVFYKDNTFKSYYEGY